MFFATVNSPEVHIVCKNNILEIMRSVTMIVRSIYEDADIDDSEKRAFKGFIKEKLGELAFMTEEELKDELEKQEAKARERDKAADELRKRLTEILGEERVDKIDKIIREVCE